VAAELAVQVLAAVQAVQLGHAIGAELRTKYPAAAVLQTVAEVHYVQLVAQAAGTLLFKK